MPHLNQILETCLYVTDIAVAEAFYGDLLGLETYARDGGRHVFFRVGQSMLLLFNPDESLKPGSVPSHGAHGPGHVAFRIEHARLVFWQSRLRERGIEIEQEYEWPDGGRSIYFRDPFGNSIEFATEDVWP